MLHCGTTARYAVRSYPTYAVAVIGLSSAGFEHVRAVLKKWSILSRSRLPKERMQVAECANADASVRKENQTSLDNRHQTSAENVDDRRLGQESRGSGASMRR